MAGGSGSGVKWVRARRLPSRCRSRLEDRDSAREGDYSMTDLDRLGLALVGFALAVVVGGVLFGLIGAWIKKARYWTDEPSSRAQWPSSLHRSPPRRSRRGRSRRSASYGPRRAWT